MALTKSTAAVDDWTAIAQGVYGIGSDYSCASNYSTLLNIQAFLDTNSTAHDGTEFVVQTSNETSGDEDWHDLTSFVGLVDASPAVTAVTTEAASGQATVAATGVGADFAVDDLGHFYVGIENNTLANSELGVISTYTASTSITLTDNLTNTHAVTTSMVCSVALSKDISIPYEASRCRVIINNNYDANGNTLNFKITAAIVTGV